MGEDGLTDDVSVERQLDLTGGAEVFVRFFRPDEEDANVRCAYEIIWPDRTRRSHGMGVDGVQALMAAMCNARAQLLVSPEGKSGAIRWLEQDTLGLPLAGSLTPEDFK